ncbi:hypothetical protein RvY_16056 [Ramazzottius varieornatus]|uniref:Uncharacterized protein n=1 Tax=Ramazzottius varieornatus TaxID=947166 RepID=A0A1D1W3P9_RAMVA|nr:hypothetical protein RvY_16056 [Ramazzottius varieornatus]
MSPALKKLPGFKCYLANPPIFATGISTESAIAYGAFKLAYFYDKSAAADPVTAPPGPANLPGAVTQPTTDVGPGDPIGQAASVVGGGGGAGGSTAGGSDGAGKRRRREAYVRRYSPSQ